MVVVWFWKINQILYMILDLKQDLGTFAAYYSDI